jgi:hypothetical protein
LIRGGYRFADKDMRQQKTFEPNCACHVDPWRAPGGNRPQQGRWTQLILPVSDCGTNASVRVDI